MASGDVVNTAARLQSAAPVNGIVVDETTQRATRHAIAYREAEPVEAKGKVEADRDLGGARGARTIRAGGPRPRGRRPRRPRARSRSRSRAALDGVREERSPQLVTLVGVPGIGKSRLLHELSRHVDAEAGAHDLATGQMPRIRRRRDVLGAGRDRQSAGRHSRGGRRNDHGSEKLRRAAEEIVDSADAEWVAARLRPLAGLEDRVRARGRPRNRGLRGLAALLRGARRAASADPRLRGSPVGRRRPARLRRRARRLGDRRSDAGRLHGSTGAARSAPELGWRKAQRFDDRDRAAVRR